MNDNDNRVVYACMCLFVFICDVCMYVDACVHIHIYMLCVHVHACSSVRNKDQKLVGKDGIFYRLLNCCPIENAGEFQSIKINLD